MITRLAAEKVAPAGSVTGVDISREMIDVATRTPSPAGAGIEWEVADATSLPFPDGSHDVVLFQIGLMFIEHRPGTVAEMRRVLVPGGRLVVNTPGVIQPAFVAMGAAIVEHISADLGGFFRAVFSMHDPEAAASLLRAAALRDVASKVTPATLRLVPPPSSCGST